MNSTAFIKLSTPIILITARNKTIKATSAATDVAYIDILSIFLFVNIFNVKF